MRTPRGTRSDAIVLGAGPARPTAGTRRRTMGRVKADSRPEGPAEDGVTAALSTGAVARRLGVAPTTLRSWERRYAIGPATREDGRHRRWTPEDISRLEEMCAKSGRRMASPGERGKGQSPGSTSRDGRPARAPALSFTPKGFLPHILT